MIHIIWDLDGTLIDSQAEILYYLKLALRDASLDISNQVKPIKIGPPLDVLLKESFPAELMTPEKINEIISRYRERYDNSGFTMTGPFDGIEEIISDTADFVHHVVTNKSNPASRLIIEKLGWTDKIASLKTQSAYPMQRRTKTDFFAEVIAESGGDGSSFIGIGDAKTDGIAAKNNGITAVGVLWGTGTGEELADCCDYLFEDTRQLRDFLYSVDLKGVTTIDKNISWLDNRI
jgi:phosphoglycolate phosphatase